MLPLGWLLAVPAGFGVVKVAASLAKWKWAVWVAVAVVVVAQQFATGYVPVTWSQTLTMKNRLAHEIGEVVPSGSTILWVGDRPHLPDARVYADYQLVHGAGELAWTKATEHAVAEVGDECGRLRACGRATGHGRERGASP